MLNWLARYAPAGAALLADGRPTGSILDVGCGPHGLACAHPDVPFVGLDVEFPRPVAPSMVGVEAPAGPLPFVDGAFDTVLSLDTLEHIPRPDRAGFVAELARVAARRVLLACPSDEGAPLDALVRKRFLAQHGMVPDWLAEHDEHVLPSVAEIHGFVEAVPGFRARPWPMVNGLLSGLLPWADLFEFSGQAAAEATLRRDEWVRLLENADFGPSFRSGWVLERVEARTPVVRLDDLDRSVAAALRCLACGAPHSWDSGAPACTSCGHLLERAPSNAWRLAAPETQVAPEPVAVAEHLLAAAETVAAPAPTVAAPSSAPERREPARALRVAPDWVRPASWLPALAAYLAAVAPEDDVTLYVEAGVALPLDAVAELMTTACEHLAGDGVFADVAIVAPDDRIPPAATVVTDAAAVRTALGVTGHDPATWDADEVVHRARWGKALADGVQALAELRAFQAAPGAWDDAEPLVSVRIPTWNGVDRLLDTAVPSVLNGLYRNVEVLVCSDGPDPAARAAVTAVADTRVRYLELPERPVYAAHPHSFWQTAGIRAVNAALDEANGAWIAPLDHDDAFTNDHIATLLAVARHHRLDMVYGDALCPSPGGAPVVIGHPELRHGGICHGAAFYSSRLKHMRYDEHSWLLDEPGDWNLWRRMHELGAAIGHVPRVILSRSPEMTSLKAQRKKSGDHTTRADAATLARDIAGTGAAWYLDVAPVAVPAAA
jgi:hypothetical protein